MREKSTSGGGFWIALCLFLFGIVGALLTGTTALVIWLSARLGLIAAALIVCLGFILMAICCYWVALREPVRRIRQQLETVSYVADLIEQGYDWVLKQCSQALGLFQRIIVEAITHRTKEPAE